MLHTVLSQRQIEADIPLCGNYFIKVGQFKVPFGREAMTWESYNFFSDYSLTYNTSENGRDVGAAIHGNYGIFTSTFGVFTGGGRDVPLRFLPEDLGCPELVARIGLNDGYDADNLDLSEVDRGPNGYAIDVDGLYTRDSRIGHSTVLNVKTSDKNLMLDADYNPFIGISPFSQGVYWQYGIDGGVRTTANKTTWSGEWELNHEGYSNDYGGLHLTTGRIQAQLMGEHIGFGLRYSFYQPDQNFTYVASGKAYTNFMGTEFVNEFVPAATYFFTNQHLKVTFELPVLPDAPVITEPGIGSYLITEMPDQVTVLSNAAHPFVVRQTVIQARLELQYQF